MARVYKLGDGVSTDTIMPGRYNVTTDRDALRRGDVIVAGRNFGCGSSREHAPLAIKQNGVAAVIAVSFARIFYRNAVNIGLPVIRCAELTEAVDDGDDITVDPRSGVMQAGGRPFHGEPPSGVALQIIEAGSLLDLVKSRGWSVLEEADVP